MSRRTVEDHARHLGTPPHELAGARHHHNWLLGQEVTEEEFRAGLAAFLGQPYGAGSPQLTDRAAAQIDATYRRNALETAELERELAAAEKSVAKLGPSAQAAILAPLRARLDQAHAAAHAEVRQIAKQGRLQEGV